MRIFFHLIQVEKTESGSHIDVLETPEAAETLTKDQLAYYARMTRGSRPKVPALRYKKPSKLPAVEVAKPGASYKPRFEVGDGVDEEFIYVYIYIYFCFLPAAIHHIISPWE